MGEGDNSNNRKRVDDMPITHVSHGDPRVPLLPPDVTEHLSAQEQSDLLCTLVDSALDAIIAHRSDGTLVFANRGAAELLGYTSDELLKIDPWGWVARDQLLGAPRRIETILHEGRLAFQSAGRRKDGTAFPTEVTSRRVDTSLGTIVVAVIRDMSHRIAAQRQLEFLAYHDALTGLGNRAYFDDRIALAIADARRYGDLLALAYVDLDEFKPVNDRYGHAVGDDVLVEIGRRLRDDVREQDLVARLGGDEFVILLPRFSSADELPVLAERIVARIEEPILASGHTLHIKASVGLALYEHGRDDARSLLVKADLAMYAAKSDPARPWLVHEEGMGGADARSDS